MKKMEDPVFKEEMINLVKTADIGIQDMTIEEEDIPLDFIEKMSLPIEIKEEILKDGGIKSVSINTYHKK